MHIEDYSPGRQSDIIALAERVLGAGFFESPNLIQHDPERVILVAVEPDDSVIGFVRGRLLPAGELQDFVERRIEDIPEELADADAKGVLGVIQTVAVDPDHQSGGVGTKLMEAVHDTIIGRGADKLIVTFKRGPNVPHVDRWMEKLGFSLWTKAPSFWKERCDLGAFKCPARREACHCEAMFYRKRVF